MTYPRAMRWLFFIVPVSLLVACGEESTPPLVPEPEAPPEHVAEPPAPEYPNEACARVVVVAWGGAMAAGQDITRSEDEARTRAGELRAQIEGGADIADIARAQSDASSSGPRGGLLGTYTRESFPAIHEPIRDAVFELSVGDLSTVLRAPYGFVVAERCPVEKIHTRHILVRYAGARNAGDVTRSEPEAAARAAELRGRVTAPGADFAAIARADSEDASAEDGGDLGMVGRGLLAQPYEEAAWNLGVGEVSQVVRSEFGFHIIERLADLPPDAP